MDVNDVLVKYVGSFGRYQKWTCFMLGMLGLIISFYAYDIVFAAAIPDHWCTPPDLNSTEFSDLLDEEVKKLTIPKVEKNGGLVYSSCLLYEDVYYDEANVSSEERKTRKCNKWTYDRSLYKTTAVTEVIFCMLTSMYKMFKTLQNFIT